MNQNRVKLKKLVKIRKGIKVEELIIDKKIIENIKNIQGIIPQKLFETVEKIKETIDTSNIKKTINELNNIGNVKRYISTEDLTKNYKEKYCYKNEKVIEVTKEDIILAWDGSIGKLNYGLEGIIGSTLARLRIIEDYKKIINANYMGYFLKTKENLLKNTSTGATIKHINRSILENIELTIPSLEIQKKIVNKLDKAQELMDKRKQQIEKFDEFLQSLFLDMFGDPVSNPKNWEIGTLRDIVSEVRYGTSKKANKDTGKYTFLRMNNITYNGNWDFSSLQYIDLDEKDGEKYLVRKGDMLFNRTNSKELVYLLK